MATSDQLLRDVYLARQPIFDAHEVVFAYEVLFRHSADNVAAVDEPDRATAELLLNAFVEIGLDAIVGTKRAFVNVTREFLVGSLPLPLEPERLVLEVLEDIAIDEELVRGVAALVERGYILALDDVVYGHCLDPLLRLVKIVKVELPRIERRDLPGHVERLRRFPVQLLAEKVETREEFDLCKSLGFDLFQGYVLSRPQMISGTQRPTSQVTILRLVSRLSDPEVSIDELEHLIGSDPVLAHKLLRYINSSKFSFRHRIESLRQVIVLLGVQQVRTLAMLIFIAGAFHGSTELLANTMIRALMCESLGRLAHHHDPHTFFTAGLLSNFDAVLGIPLGEILDSLQLSADLRDAVLNHSGSVGQAVRTVLAQERGDLSQVGFGRLAPGEIRDAYLWAIHEAGWIQTELMT